MNNTKDNQPILGFWSYSNGFLIGEYFPQGTHTAEFNLELTAIGFEAHIYDKSWKIILNPILEKLWDKTKDITTMGDMESYLINIGLMKLD